VANILFLKAFLATMVEYCICMHDAFHRTLMISRRAGHN
jgi:hypothetical protein